MRKIAYISLLALALAAACSDSDEQAQLVSIASLRNFETNSRSMLLTQNIVIEGLVTANDQYGEFSNCIVIEDASSALMILCEMDDIYLEYPFGSHLQISCSGLYLINHYGALKLGSAPTDEYTLDYISQSKIGQYIKKIDQIDSPTPRTTTLEELTILHTYSYVELCDITITNDNDCTTYCERNPDTGHTMATTHQIIDQNGDSAELYVSSQCVYADRQLPTTTATIYAIVEYYDTQYSLRITHKGIIEP